VHDQLNKLDSIWAYKLNRQHPEKSSVVRFVALGLDSLAGVLELSPSDMCRPVGSLSSSPINGLIGARTFKRDRARLFFTQQHGENNLFEVFPATE
jgi:hypothetical protein